MGEVNIDLVDDRASPWHVTAGAAFSSLSFLLSSHKEWRDELWAMWGPGCRPLVSKAFLTDRRPPKLLRLCSSSPSLPLSPSVCSVVSTKAPSSLWVKQLICQSRTDWKGLICALARIWPVRSLGCRVIQVDYLCYLSVLRTDWPYWTSADWTRSSSNPSSYLGLLQ